jgi:hypothetical protein
MTKLGWNMFPYLIHLLCLKILEPSLFNFMELCFTASAKKCLCINSKVKLHLKSVNMSKLSNFFLTHCLIDIAYVMA